MISVRLEGVLSGQQFNANPRFSTKCFNLWPNQDHNTKSDLSAVPPDDVEGSRGCYNRLQTPEHPVGFVPQSARPHWPTITGLCGTAWRTRATPHWPYITGLWGTLLRNHCPIIIMERDRDGLSDRATSNPSVQMIIVCFRHGSTLDEYL